MKQEKPSYASLLYFLVPLFLNRAFASVKDVEFDDFYLSDDGQTMTICVSAGDRTSYRYIRSMSVKKDSNSIYLTFRPTFFGKLGAKDTFQISLQGGQKRIVVGSPTDSTGVGLSWNTDSGWQPYHFSVQNTQ